MGIEGSKMQPSILILLIRMLLKYCHGHWAKIIKLSLIYTHPGEMLERGKCSLHHELAKCA